MYVQYKEIIKRVCSISNDIKKEGKKRRKRRGRKRDYCETQHKKDPLERIYCYMKSVCLCDSSFSNLFIPFPPHSIREYVSCIHTLNKINTLLVTY